MSAASKHMRYINKVRRHTPWPRVRCHGCWFTHNQFHSQFHSRQYSLHSSQNSEICNIGAHAHWSAWTGMAWQRSGSDERPPIAYWSHEITILPVHRHRHKNTETFQNRNRNLEIRKNLENLQPWSVIQGVQNLRSKMTACKGKLCLKIIWSTCSMTTCWHHLPLKQYYVNPVINEVVVLIKLVEKNEMR